MPVGWDHCPVRAGSCLVGTMVPTYGFQIVICRSPNAISVVNPDLAPTCTKQPFQPSCAEGAKIWRSTSSN